jgi:hypothetical protein
MFLNIKKDFLFSFTNFGSLNFFIEIFEKKIQTILLVSKLAPRYYGIGLGK